MRDLLCPPSELLSPDSSKSDDQVLVEDQCLDGEVVSGVGEPAAYLQLAGQLLAWLAARLATTEESGWLASYNRANLGESMVVSLAGLVKEVDTEMTNNNLPAQLQVVHGKVMSRVNLRVYSAAASMDRVQRLPILADPQPGGRWLCLAHRPALLPSAGRARP